MILKKENMKRLEHPSKVEDHPNSINKNNSNINNKIKILIIINILNHLHQIKGDMIQIIIGKMVRMPMISNSKIFTNKVNK